MSETFDLVVRGMSCEHCVRAVKEALENVEGVRNAVVEIGKARVEADEGVARQKLVAALLEAGYEVA